ncbi:DNA-binding PucR family transcriptional regulator [Saccharopolyspora erythraea NRRL 2338]|uniref:DNA-binding protein n=3 Tax=Saccharopolyspora erythraea TaxID=1836 RepID=A4FKT5_SACEN|nr:PucR family transcriptional regulator [Saccharopolyspora erythraea]PFG98298.1 DNA-binding PucR family transcriptional regulator [Saccharopolyspora erythraea NRRL 2338]QRK88385.1 helix-turn-helix domain-containing protein [Saccharopolyspora erythraea]CAM04660.1 putative DNA-binding protein [Saccharopolyspora erythraea NRRL 2338]
MVKLDRLINVLGGLGARLVCAPRSRRTELRSVALHDPAEPADRSDDVLLAVGVDASAAAELLASTRAAVVVFRASELGDGALATAGERGVAVVVAAPEVSWGQLAGVVYGLVLEGRETEAGRGPTDLFALADTLAGSVGGPVTIEDHHCGVLAYSSEQTGADPARLETILGRRVPEAVRRELAARGVFEHLAASDQPLFVEPLEAGAGRGRAVAAVRAGRELLGSIWVETPAPLGPAGETALVNGARTAALHMLRSRASADLERQIESDLVIGLVEGDGDPAAELSRLGFRGASFRVVAVQAHDGGEHAASALLAFERATTGFGWTRPGRSALFANTVYTVLPYDEAARAREWVRTLARDIPSGITVLAGIGGAAGPGELVSSRQEADESLALHAARGGAEVAVVYDDDWHEILLQRLRRAAGAGRQPARGPVARLRRHDEVHGTHYAETLRAWLECQSDLAAAAARLGIHPNTVRNRMRKMAEIVPLELDDPDARLAMIIALAV